MSLDFHWIFHDSHDCHEFFESANVELEELKFFFENFEHVVYNLDEVDFATSDHLTAALNIRSYSWENKLGINLTITFYKSVAELSWDEHPTWLEDLHVVSQDDIVNVSCNRSICANTVLFHLRYEISFAQIAGSLGSTLNNPTRFDEDLFADSKVGDGRVFSKVPRHNLQETWPDQYLTL